MPFEVDVQPLATCLARSDHGFGHQPRANAKTPNTLINHGVEDERVYSSIPCHLDESD